MVGLTTCSRDNRWPVSVARAAASEMTFEVTSEKSTGTRIDFCIIEFGLKDRGESMKTKKYRNYKHDSDDGNNRSCEDHFAGFDFSGRKSDCVGWCAYGETHPESG